MEPSPSWEANSCSATWGIPNILRNTEVYYCVRKNLPLVSILGQMNPVHTHHPIIIRSILILLSHLCLGLPSGLLSPRFSYRNPVRMSHIHTTTSHPPKFYYYNTSGMQYILWISLLCSFLQLPIYYFTPVGPNILHTLFSNTISPGSSLNAKHHVSYPYKTTGELSAKNESERMWKEVAVVYFEVPSPYLPVGI
jgi:hypothetical protein